MSKRNNAFVLILFLSTGLLCLIGGCAVGIWALFQASAPTTTTPSPDLPSLSTPTPDTAAPTPTAFTPPPPAVQGQALTMLHTLAQIQVPENDPVDLAKRLEHKTINWNTPEAPPTYHLGDHQTFWITNEDTRKSQQVETVLAAAEPHVYLWVDTRVRYRQRDAQAVARFFEEHIYPTNRAFFGSEWTPGIDGDPHIYIIYAYGLGSGIAGYFSSVDELPPGVHEYTNAHETFMLSADNLDLGGDEIKGVLAHEFQHMIHWYRDRNESTWLNEGFAELAAQLNHVRTSGFEYSYAFDPDIQLTAWPDPADSNTVPHYGAAYLFVAYFLDHFGEQATRALVADPTNGMTSVEQVLRQLGSPYDADQIFLDWAIANYLQDAGLDQGRYGYREVVDSLPSFNPTETLDGCQATWSDTVHQYGVDYIQLNCDGPFTLTFQGTTTVPVVPTQPHSGDYAFWSNYGDESDMTLTRRYDLSGLSSATLTYWTWFDIEQDYDYVYVEASRDGQTWDILTTPSGTDADPTGNSLGWGYTGTSGEGSTPRWVQETVDLSAYAGGPVWIRFEYITDAAVNRTGFLVDDITIPELGDTSDFEEGDDGWEAQGFVRLFNALPQRYGLALILKPRNGEPQVRYLEPDATQHVSVTLNGGDYTEVILVVSGTTRFTRQSATYRLTLQTP